MLTFSDTISYNYIFTSYSETQTTAVGGVRPSKKKQPSQQKGQQVNLVDRFPCKSRTGISCAVDTAWSKRGFDSLTCMYK